MWLELSITIAADREHDVEAALEDLGALAITLVDAEDHPIFEPPPGETPVWPRIGLTALFEDGVDRAGLVHALGDLVPDIGPGDIAFRTVEDQDWTRAWMDRFRPMAFGRRLWIYPSNIEPPDDDALVVVRLDPGLAFGAGTHPTTALCLEWLDAGENLAGATLIDYGSGSGVLAVAALKLGAARVVAVDNDPQALVATRDNAERNGVGDRLATCLPDDFRDFEADALVANILAGPLAALAPRFAACLRPGGALALSGILAGQQHELVERYVDAFEAFRITERDGWIRIAARRRAA